MNVLLIQRSRWVLLILSSLCVLASPVFADDTASNGPVVQVAPPSGDAAIDAFNIQAAIDMATPGAVVQFSPGTYQLAPSTQFVIFVDDITLQGDDDIRTTILGEAAFPADLLFQGDFLLVGSRTTIRHLTFDGFDYAIEVFRDDVQPTGHVIEHCTFRNGFLPIQTWSFSDDLIHIRKNRMINTQFAIRVFGKTVHFIKNKVTAPEPETMLAGKPFAVAIIYPQFPLGVSENNVFAANKIIGNADGFLFVSFDGGRITNSVVRDNNFIDMRVWFDFDFSTMVWLDATSFGGDIEGNIIEGNKANGNEGIGILLTGANDNYIVGNDFDNFVAGDVLPWPLVYFDLPLTGIVLFNDTSGNYVLENKFKNVPNPIEDWGTDNVVENNQVK